MPSSRTTHVFVFLNNAICFFDASFGFAYDPIKMNPMIIKTIDFLRIDPISTLFEELKKRKIKWSAQVDVHIADDEHFLSLMKESGCNYLYIGFESVNDKTLKSYGKHQDRGDIEKCAKRLHKHNIRKHGMFVFGSDEDKPETVEDTVRFCRKNNIESVQFLVLTPLPGTKDYQELGDRVVIKDWNLYDGHHAVFSPKNFTREQLQELAIKGMEKFYSWGRDLKIK